MLDLIADPYSFSNPDQVLVRHLDIDWNISFEKQAIEGNVVLEIDNKQPDNFNVLILDSRNLKIKKVENATRKQEFHGTSFTLGPTDPIKGQPLVIDLKPSTKFVKISYSTQHNAEALQWVSKSQTTSKKHPMLFTVACPIHARDFIPLQDTPQVRVTYSANITTSPGLIALMSADNNPLIPNASGIYHFEMTKPIPSYLISLAVGDFKFKSYNKVSGIYAEEEHIKEALNEFTDLGKMIEVSQKLFGPYLWGRYDLLVLPNFFPAAAMENPLLTFISPTLITRDKSFVSVISHELAHSWSGNLITNGTWNDVWLNEGITTYMQNRIVEEVYGKAQSEVELRISYENLLKYKSKLQREDFILDQSFRNPNPDEVFTLVPYIKGALFMRHLEQIFGREEIDRFLKDYITNFAFKSISTQTFREFLGDRLISKFPEKSSKAQVDIWLNSSEFPSNFEEPSNQHLILIEQQAKNWSSGKTALAQLESQNWRGQQWAYFIDKLPKKLDSKHLKELSKRLNLEQGHNANLVSKWLVLAIASNYKEANSLLERFLIDTGKMSLVKPIYEELVKTPEGLEVAKKIYEIAKNNYHSLTIREVDKVVQKAKQLASDHKEEL